MYKIVKTIQPIEQLNAIVSNRENNPEAKYCEINKHCTQELYAIPIMPAYLATIGAPAELLHNTVEQLPDGWAWHFTECPIRLVVDKKKLTIDIAQNTPIGQLVNYAIGHETIKNQIIDLETSEVLYIYLRYLEPTHQTIIENSNTIVIENA